MHPRATPANIRERIALVLQADTKQYETAGVCDRLGMPPEPENAWAYNSKRVYVTQRLAGVSLADLLRIARNIVEEFGDEELEELLASTGMRGTDGALKNLIFAAIGATPRIVLRDAIENIIEIVEGADRCLVYDRPLGPAGLTWGDLVEWWADGGRAASPADARALHGRMYRSLASPPERLLFQAYGARYGADGGGASPALVPQVYLHYDPYTKRELREVEGQELVRQRMDFLLLPNDRRRIVIEVDGRQHYADRYGTASPGLYATMVSEDRRLQLAGYEVFRFGAAELQDGASARSVAEAFFDELLARQTGSST